jgi:hypothetical protein
MTGLSTPERVQNNGVTSFVSEICTQKDLNRDVESGIVVDINEIPHDCILEQIVVLVNDI